MSTAKFTTAAAAKIVTATKTVLGAANDKRGDRRTNRSIDRDSFYAIIGDNSGTFGSGSLNYAWQECDQDGTVLTDGRSGTTDTNPAINDYEEDGNQPTQPIGNGTRVRIWFGYTGAAQPFYHFYLMQLPLLSEYQGWYANSGGTIANDYLRMSP